MPMLYFIAWYLVLALFGLAALPLGWTWFRHLPDRGWGLLRPLGLLLVGFAVWFLGTFGLLRLDAGSGVGGLLLLFGLGAGVLVRWGGGWDELRAWLREHRTLVLAEEILFLVALAWWVWYRIHDVEGIQYTERPMDFALFNAILRGGEMPPNDPWLSGFTISYYYLGYLIMAQVTALSGVISGIGYNLAFASLAALTSVGTFSLSYNLIAGTEPEPRRLDVTMGMALLSVLLVLGISNLTGVLVMSYHDGIGSPATYDWFRVNDLTVDPATGRRPQEGWWWWPASRTVSDYNPDGGRIEIIDEFPFFSFMLGDMHPHVLALPFALLGLTLAFNALRGALSAPVVTRWRRLQLPPDGWGLGEGYGKLLFVLTAIVVGAMGMLNTWDLPTQGTLLAAVWLVAALTAHQGERRGAIVGWLSAGAALLLGALVLYLPFYIGFSSQADGIRLSLWATRPQHYGLMFGLFLLALIPFILSQGRRVQAALRTVGRRALAVCGVMLLLDSLALLFLLQLNLDEARLAPLMAIFWLLIPLALAALLDAEEPTPLAIAQVALFPVLAGLATQRWTLVLVATLLALTLLALWARVRQLLPLAQPAASRQPLSTRPAIAGGSQEATASQVALEPPLHSAMAAGEASLLFALLLTAMALLLTMGSEIFYIKDGFGGRMNTVFKLYYQAWVLMALASTFALSYLAKRLPLVLRVPWLALFALLTLASTWYPIEAVQSKADLDGAAHWDGRFWMQMFDPDRFAAIEWLNRQPGQRVILEKAGGAYNPSESALAGWTGHSTLLGWENHEGQWRGDYEEIGRRQPIIRQIYESTDAEATRALIEAWHIDYVAITPQEVSTFNLTAPQIDKFRTFMTPVFEQGNVLIFGR